MTITARKRNGLRQNKVVNLQVEFFVKTRYICKKRSITATKMLVTRLISYGSDTQFKPYAKKETKLCKAISNYSINGRNDM